MSGFPESPFEEVIAGMQLLVLLPAPDGRWRTAAPIPEWAARLLGEAARDGRSFDLDATLPSMGAMDATAELDEPTPDVMRRRIGPWSEYMDDEILLLRASVLAEGESDRMVILERLHPELLEAYQLARDRKVSLDVLTDTHERLAEDAKRFRQLMMLDDLTGIHNRRGFRVLAEQQLKFAGRMGIHLALLYIDLNDLKKINDEWGHSHGDAALQSIAKAMQAAFRESDVIGRIGGDEFAALVTKGPEFDAAGLFRRIAQAVSAESKRGGAEHPVSVSLGMSHFDPDAPLPLEQLIQGADVEMYRDKTRKRRI